MRILIAAAVLVLGIFTLGASLPSVSSAKAAPAGVWLVSSIIEQTVAPSAHGDCEDGCHFCSHCGNCASTHSGAATMALAAYLDVPGGDVFSVPKHYTLGPRASIAGPYRPPRA